MACSFAASGQQLGFCPVGRQFWILIGRGSEGTATTLGQRYAVETEAGGAC